MNLADLLKPWVTDSLPTCNITAMAHDSRRVTPGSVFFAYPGDVTDGREYIHQAIDAGASAVVYESAGAKSPSIGNMSVPCIPLLKLQGHLGLIASRFYNNPSRLLAVTGVTGTNGKTSIASMLAEAHEQLGQPAAYIGTLGEGGVSHLRPLSNTTPDALTVQRLLHEYATQSLMHVCMEVSSHALIQARVAGVSFKQAIYTNLSHDHLDYHHDMRSYAEAKATLFACDSLEVAIINHDDEWASLMEQQCSDRVKVLTYGLQSAADICASNIKMTSEGSKFDVSSPWGTHVIQTMMFGTFNIYNCLAVFASLMSHEYDVQAVIACLAKLQTATGRMEKVASHPLVIVDFAHTPDALRQALEVLASMKESRLIAVFGCGGDRDKKKRPLMGKIASELADYIIITNDNPRTEDPKHIAEEIIAGISNTHTDCILDRQQAIEAALAMAQPSDIILIAGKGHETEQHIGSEHLFFSDQAVVKSYFAKPQ